MQVQASPGLKCPMETDPRSYIDDNAKGVTVPDTAYYRRLVDDGSLVIVAPKPTAQKGNE